MTLRLELAAVSHRGVVREANEDAVSIAGWVLTSEGPEVLALDLAVEHPVDLIVADGLGGHLAGERASREALAAFALAAEAGSDPVAAVHAADEALHALGSSDRRLSGMGSTIVGARIAPDATLTIFNVGDSRAYRMIGGYLGLLSEDDRLGGTGNTVGQVLGGSRRMVIDAHPYSTVLGEGEIVLLCSDGLSDVLGDERIAELSAPPIAEAAAALLAASLDAGAPDNVTFLLFRIAAAG